MFSQHVGHASGSPKPVHQVQKGARPPRGCPVEDPNTGWCTWPVPLAKTLAESLAVQGVMRTGKVRQRTCCFLLQPTAKNYIRPLPPEVYLIRLVLAEGGGSPRLPWFAPLPLACTACLLCKLEMRATPLLGQALDEALYTY